MQTKRKAHNGFAVICVMSLLNACLSYVRRQLTSCSGVDNVLELPGRYAESDIADAKAVDSFGGYSAVLAVCQSSSFLFPTVGALLVPGCRYPLGFLLSWPVLAAAVGGIC